MKRVLVFQHVPYAPLGTLNTLLKTEGFRIRYVNFAREPNAKIDINKYEGLIILGGPMSVYEEEKYPHLKTEMEVIQMALERKFPTLGICLGAQLIASTLGAEVKPNPTKEIGWYAVQPTQSAKEDPILRLLGPSQAIFQWHGDTFELPTGAEHLAQSPACPNQAFRYKDHVYGFQFHLEVDAPMIARWLTIESHRKQMAEEGITQEKLQTDTQKHLPNSLTLSHKIFGQFLSHFGTKTRRPQLRSR